MCPALDRQAEQIDAFAVMTELLQQVEQRSQITVGGGGVITCAHVRDEHLELGLDLLRARRRAVDLPVRAQRDHLAVGVDPVGEHAFGGDLVPGRGDDDLADVGFLVAALIGVDEVELDLVGRRDRLVPERRDGVFAAVPLALGIEMRRADRVLDDRRRRRTRPARPPCPGPPPRRGSACRPGVPGCRFTPASPSGCRCRRTASSRPSSAPAAHRSPGRRTSTG